MVAETRPPVPNLIDPLTKAEIAAARSRIADTVLRTPLVQAGERRLWLKLECLQPFGSYKIRGATNAVKARLEPRRCPRCNRLGKCRKFRSSHRGGRWKTRRTGDHSRP